MCMLGCVCAGQFKVSWTSLKHTYTMILENKNTNAPQKKPKTNPPPNGFHLLTSFTPTFEIALGALTVQLVIPGVVVV